MNSVTSSISPFLPQSIAWTPAVASVALITGAFLTTYVLKNIFTLHSKDDPGFAEQSRQVAPINAGSKWAYLNPLTLIAKTISTIFSLMLSPYYLLFGEKEYWMNHLPTPIHYNQFNGGLLTSRAQRARTNMKGFLEALGAKDFKGSLAKGSLPGWSGIQALDLPKGRQYSYGSFYLTGEEIEKQANSLKVSYDPTIISSRQLNSILTQGSSSPKDEAIARGRMVSSLVASTCDSKGNTISREGAIPLYRVYTSNAPNLAYSPYDRSQFLNANGKLNKEKYTKEMERIFLHYFEEAKANRDNVVVLCGFGMGAFMTPDLLPDGQRCFVEALRKATEAQGKHFEKMIFADPNKKLTPFISTIPNMTITNKSCLDIAHHGAKKGYKVALFNPGDGSGIPGQFWLQGHIALEEMFGLFTTLLISQHPHCNPLVGNRSVYRSR